MHDTLERPFLGRLHQVLPQRILRHAIQLILALSTATSLLKTNLGRSGMRPYPRRAASTAGRDRFHSVPICPKNITDVVENVPTGRERAQRW